MNPIAQVLFLLRHADHFAWGLAERPLLVCAVIVGVVFVDTVLPLGLAPSTAMLFAVGLEASRARISPVPFGLCAFVALLAADYTNRAVGHLLRRALHPKPFPLSNPLFNWGATRVAHLLLASALLPVRGVGPLIAGAAKVPSLSFFIASTTGAALWVAISMAAGAAAAAGTARAHHHWLIQGVVAACVIFLGPALWRPRSS